MFCFPTKPLIAAINITTMKTSTLIKYLLFKYFFKSNNIRTTAAKTDIPKKIILLGIPKFFVSSPVPNNTTSNIYKTKLIYVIISIALLIVLLDFMNSPY